MNTDNNENNQVNPQATPERPAAAFAVPGAPRKRTREERSASPSPEFGRTPSVAAPRPLRYDGVDSAALQELRRIYQPRIESMVHGLERSELMLEELEHVMRALKRPPFMTEAQRKKYDESRAAVTAVCTDVLNHPADDWLEKVQCVEPHCVSMDEVMRDAFNKAGDVVDAHALRMARALVGPAAAVAEEKQAIAKEEPGSIAAASEELVLALERQAAASEEFVASSKMYVVALEEHVEALEEHVMALVKTNAAAEEEPVNDAEDKPVVAAEEEPVVAAEEEPVVALKEEPVVAAEEQVVAAVEPAPAALAPLRYEDLRSRASRFGW